MSARLLATWTDPRASNARVTYRLIADRDLRIIERCERDTLGGERWVKAHEWTQSGRTAQADARVLLVDLIEGLMREKQAAAVQHDRADEFSHRESADTVVNWDRGKL